MQHYMDMCEETEAEEVKGSDGWTMLEKIWRGIQLSTAYGKTKNREVWRSIIRTSSSADGREERRSGTSNAVKPMKMSLEVNIVYFLSNCFVMQFDNPQCDYMQW